MDSNKPALIPRPYPEAFGRISAKEQLAKDPDVRFLLGTIKGEVPDLTLVIPPPADEEVDKIIEETVNGLADGTVIADFFLPYLCCSDCAPVQFVLPKTPPTFSLETSCTNPNNQAEVSISPEGGMPPYSVKVDDQDYRPIIGAILLSAGSHTLTIRDSESTESAPQVIEIAPQLSLGEPDFECIGDNNEYIAVMTVQGGTPPYTANRGTFSGNTYTSDLLPGDTDVEIKITDSRDCSTTTTIDHSCLPPLAFTTQIACTTPNNVAQVQVLPTGGVAPYEVRVGNARFTPLTGPLSLPVGQHQIRVRDANRVQTPSTRVIVPPQLALSVLRYVCEGTDQYQAVLQIQGGTPPYIINGTPLTGIQFTTPLIPSGNAENFEVIDQNKCNATTTVQHTCEEECDLPCGGISQRCAYRLWLQPPLDEAPYEIYRQARSLISFRFNGETIAMPGTSTILQIDPSNLNGDYQGSMAQVIKILNERINQALVSRLGEAGNNRLVLTFEPAETDPFGIFWIEHFICDTFSIEFSYTYAKPSPTNTLTIRYTNEVEDIGRPFRGAIITNRRFNNKETRIPAFDCSQRNQCKDGVYEKVCQDIEPKPTFFIESLGRNQFQFGGKMENMPDAEIAAWVWDPIVALPLEPLYEGQQVNATLQKPGGVVRLTVITQKGCFGFIDESIGQ